MEAVRSRLLAAALQQLEEAETVSDVTIATLTRAVGCTPPSLYHYWPTRDALLEEAAALGWAEFGRDQQDGPETGSPGERIIARGRAYVRFAERRPQLFRLLFLTRSSDGAGPGSSFLSLVADVAAGQEVGEVPAGAPERLALALWAAAHGAASLLYARPSMGVDAALGVLDELSAPLVVLAGS